MTRTEPFIATEGKYKGRRSGEKSGTFCPKCGGEKVLVKRRQTRLMPNCYECARTWRTSETGQDYHHKYKRTDEYREYQKEYRKTDGYKKSSKKYKRSDKGKRTRVKSVAARRARQYQSECPKCMGDSYYTIRQDADCYICGAPATSTDHKRPISKGGLHCNKNFAPACTGCNSAKGNRLYPGGPGWKAFKQERIRIREENELGNSD